MKEGPLTPIFRTQLSPAAFLFCLLYNKCAFFTQKFLGVDSYWRIFFESDDGKCLNSMLGWQSNAMRRRHEKKCAVGLKVNARQLSVELFFRMMLFHVCYLYGVFWSLVYHNSSTSHNFRIKNVPLKWWGTFFVWIFFPLSLYF